MISQSNTARRALGEAIVVVALGALAGFANNALSSRSIPLMGEWKKAYGVPSPGGRHAPTYGNREIGLGEAVALSSEGALFIDARPAEKYNKKHIPGALSLPEERIEGAVRDVLEAAAEGEDVVVYCQSSDCDEAHLLASRLREAGVKNLAVFAGGMDEWEKAGKPVESGREEAK